MAKAKISYAEIISLDQIASRIFLIRSQKVMIDSHLEDLYRVPTKSLNLAVKRNLSRGAMLSSVLKSERAAEVNVSIMRTFVRLRQAVLNNEELARRVAQHDHEIGVLFEHVESMLAPVPAKVGRMGFVPMEE